MKEQLDSYFELSKRGSNFRIEILAGLSTFLSLSYIFIVNPAILSDAGMDPSFVLFATIVTSGLATIAMGIWGRLPFALAPGLEMNAYIAYAVVAVMGFTWQEAIGGVFWSGIVFMVLTLTGIREAIIHSIPTKMKFALSLSVGVFVMAIGLRLSGILVWEGVWLRDIGSLQSKEAFALYMGIVCIIALRRMKVRAAILISIIVVSVYCHFVGIGKGAATAGFGRMFDGIGGFDISVLWRNPSIITAVVVLFLIDFYGSVAKFIGLTMKTPITEVDAQDRVVVPRTKQALMVDGIATTLGSYLGTSSVTTFVESAVGIAAGGVTGITAITCGVLMLFCLFLMPLLVYVPVVATTGTLVYVGWILIPRDEIRQSYTSVDKAVAIILPIIVLFTFSLDRAMLVGFVAYIVVDFIQKRKVNYVLALSSILLALGWILQMKSS